jgi:hypothetical protein
MNQSQVPSYRHHKSSGRGFVELNGRRIYLGPYGLPETEEAYHRTLAEWIANGRQLPVDDAALTVVEVCDAYWQWASGYYRHRNGTKSTFLDGVRRALKLVRKLCGSVPAADFGPKALRTLRQQWID